MILQRLVRCLRWLSGEEFPPSPSAPVADDLEPYCNAATLLARRDAVPGLSSGEDRAIHKIGARYGAEL